MQQALSREQQVAAIGSHYEQRVRERVRDGNLSLDELIGLYANAVRRHAALLPDAALAAEYRDTQESADVDEAVPVEINGLTYRMLVDCYQNARDGQGAVEALCAKHGITERAYCGPCETDTPTFDDVCAVCGTVR